jgi:hypothetical protein
MTSSPSSPSSLSPRDHPWALSRAWRITVGLSAVAAMGLTACGDDGEVAEPTSTTEGTTTTEATPAETDFSTPLEVGDCFNSQVSGAPDLSDPDEFEVVDCSDPHDGEVFGISSQEGGASVIFCEVEATEYFDDGIPSDLVIWSEQIFSADETLTFCAVVESDLLD